MDLLIERSEQFWELVLRRNRDLQIDSITREQAISDWRGKREALYPRIAPLAAASRVHGPGSGIETDKIEASSTISQWIPGGGQVSVVPAWSWSKADYGTPWPESRQDTGTLSIAWSQPLLRNAWGGDTTWKNMRLARQNVVIAGLEVRVKIRQLREDASRTWWDGVVKAVTVLIAQSDSIACEELLSLSRRKLSGGAGSVIDTLSARAERDRAVAELVDARIGWDQFHESIGRLTDSTWILEPNSLGIPQDLHAGNRFPAVPTIEASIWKISEDAWLNSVENNAPEIALAMARLDQAESIQRMRWWNRLPMIDVGLMGKTGLPEIANHQWQWSAKANMTWEFPNSEQNNAYRKAVLEVRKQGKAAIQARRAIREEYRRLRKELRWAEARVAYRAQAATSQSLRNSALKYAWVEGVGDLESVLQAQREWVAALRGLWKNCADLKITMISFVESGMR